MARLQEDQRRLQIRLRAQLSEDTRKLREKFLLADVDDDGDLLQRARLARSQLCHRRNELRWQVIDAEVAEVFERPNSLRFPGPGESRQNDESPRPPARQDGFHRHTCPPCSTSSSES